MNKNTLTVGIPFYKKTNVEYLDIAIMSIIIATGLFLEILSPSNELTLKGKFLLYEAYAKHKPKEE